MIKSLVDPLLTIREILENIRDKKQTTAHGSIYIRNNISLINDFIASSYQIEKAESDFVRALTVYTGGSNLIELSLRTEEENNRLYQNALSALRSYSDALRLATASDIARKIRSVDETEVDSPF